MRESRLHSARTRTGAALPVGATYRRAARAPSVGHASSSYGSSTPLWISQDVRSQPRRRTVPHAASVPELLTYGEFVQAAYDNVRALDQAAVQATGIDLNLGVDDLTPRWGKEELFANALRGSTTDARRYTCVEYLEAYSGKRNVQARSRSLPVADDEQPSWIGFLAERKEGDTVAELVFVFRGTLLDEEWDSNIFGVNLVTYDEKNPGLGMVHKGFRNMYTSTLEGVKSTPKDTPEQLVTKILERYKDCTPFPKVTTTGHSLGGALAQLCAFDVAQKLRALGRDVGPGRVHANTFASPRVGNYQFKKSLENLVEVTRVENKADAVPRIPIGTSVGSIFGLVSQLAALISSRAKSSSQSSTTPNGNVKSSEITDLLDVVLNQEELQPLKVLDRFLPFGQGRYYWHAGSLVGIDSTKDPTGYLKNLWSDGKIEIGKELSVAHNMEVYLHLLSYQDNIRRDFALINKATAALEQEVMDKYKIPESWWQPDAVPPHKGLVLHEPQLVWRPPDWPGQD